MSRRKSIKFGEVQELLNRIYEDYGVMFPFIPSSEDEVSVKEFTDGKLSEYHYSPEETEDEDVCEEQHCNHPCKCCHKRQKPIETIEEVEDATVEDAQDDMMMEDAQDDMLAPQDDMMVEDAQDDMLAPQDDGCYELYDCQDDDDDAEDAKRSFYMTTEQVDEIMSRRNTLPERNLISLKDIEKYKTDENRYDLRSVDKNTVAQIYFDIINESDEILLDKIKYAPAELMEDVESFSDDLVVSDDKEEKSIMDNKVYISDTFIDFDSETEKMPTWDEVISAYLTSSDGSTTLHLTIEPHHNRLYTRQFMPGTKHDNCKIYISNPDADIKELVGDGFTVVSSCFYETYKFKSNDKETVIKPYRFEAILELK